MTEVKTELLEAVSASFTGTPVDDGPEGLETFGGVVEKGKLEDGGAAYQATIDGVAGDIKKGFGAAIKDAMRKVNMVADNYDLPSKWTDVKPTNAAEPEPESLDDLEASDKKAFNAGYKKLADAFAKDDKAIEARRKANFDAAKTFVSVRDTFDSKKAWGLFVKFAPEDNGVKAFLGGKNTAGEYYKAGKLMAVEGFDADTMVSERVSGAKGVVTQYGTMLAAVAKNVVAYAHHAAYCKKVGVDKDMNTTQKLMAVLRDMIDQGHEYHPENGVDAVTLDDMSQAMAEVIVPLHVANIGDTTQVFDVDDGAAKALKVEGGYAAGSLFGTEGADELVAALARAYTAYHGQRAATVAESSVEQATGEMVKEAKASGTRFADWDADRAARHLANILFAGWDADADGDDMAAQRGRIDEILTKMGGWADAIFEQEATVADILSDEPTPTSVEDGTDEADAEINE